MKYFFNHPLSNQFYRFCLIGFLNVLIDVSVYFALTRLFDWFQTHYLVANFLSFLVAVSNSFYWNRNWTFKYAGTDIGKQYLKFFLVSLIGLGLNEIILFSSVHFLQLYDLLAKMIAIGIVLFWNFGANRFWTFRR